jgi:hypothetical protein
MTVIIIIINAVVMTDAGDEDAPARGVNSPQRAASDSCWEPVHDLGSDVLSRYVR